MLAFIVAAANVIAETMKGGMKTASKSIPVADRSYTVVTCHFGDRFWIEHAVSKLDALSDARLREIIVVDQSRASESQLGRLPRVSRVLTFPVDEREVEILGHDHPAALNRAVRSVQFSTSHVIVLDSDCFPIVRSWLDRLADVTVAADPAKWGLTHPCFLVFPVEYALCLDFAEGLHEVEIDTGRLVGLQLARAGADVIFTRAKSAFRGYRGALYLDGAIYHHGHGSFIDHPDARVGRQVAREDEEFFRKRVARQRYDLTSWEYLCRRVGYRLKAMRGRH